MKRNLLLFIAVCLNFSAWAQSRVISGRVSTEVDNDALPGVNIIVQGKGTGTVTDIDGNYSLNIEEGDVVLVFSYIGYQTKEVNVGNSNTINVMLIEDNAQLDEVVVTGFQEVERKLFTGSASRIEMAEIRSPGMVDASRMLEGQVAGVTVDNVSGTFGTAPKIRIRGNTSINGDNQPLWVVDGVILEDLTNVSADDIITGNTNTVLASSIAGLNPDDIASFEVLKDASATALYGTRAKNGVIVITTKKGRSGALRVNYSGNYSFRLRPSYNQFDILNSGDEMSIYREMYEKGLVDITTSVRAQNYGPLGKMFSLISEHEIPWGINGTLNEEFLNQYENANTDWFDVLYKDVSLQQQHSVSLTSGTENYNSYYSLSYLNDNGQTVADKVKRFSGTARNTFYFSDRFTLDTKLNASFRQQSLPGTTDRDFDPITGRFKRDFDINPFSYAINTSRSIRPYDSNGELEYFRRNYAPFNILEELSLNYIDVRVADISAQADFNFKILDNLTFRSTMQGRYAATNREHIIHEWSNQAEAYRADGTQYIQDANPLLYQDPDEPGSQPKVVLPEGGFNYLDESDLLNFYIRNSVEWSETFGQLHQVNVLGGQEIKFTDRSSRSADGIGVVYENGGVVNTDPDIIEFLNRQGVDFYSLSEDRERFAGLFLNAGYSFNDKYVVNGTVRYDGSNRLGKSRSARYLPTWNVSGAWNLDQERFLNLPSVISYLKIRGTYGLSANLGPDVSALLNLQSDVTLRPTDNESYLYIEDLENQDLTWEKLNELNVGMDFGLLNDRITGTIDYFKRDAFDLIGVLQTSGVGGVAYKLGNFADLQANGFEFSINTLNYQDQNFSWSTNFNIGYTKDIVTRLDFGPRIADAISAQGAPLLDGPRRGIYSTKFAGLDARGIPTFYDLTGETVYDYNLQERDSLEKILQYEGPSEPRGAGGLTNNLRYKNFSLNVLFSYKFGYKIRLNDAFYPNYTDFSSFSKTFVDRWVVPGDEEFTNIPVILDQRIVQGDNTAQYRNAYDLYNKSTVRVADGGYVRLKTVRLTYNLPQSLAGKIGARTATLGVEGQNLWLVYSDEALNGQDPEFFSAGGVAFPQPRQVTFTLNVGF
ncbi:TonB-linked SusC/RagA family outer membrane protein [Catalinimonas alkaloidigena]|uniref:SusC/RagA family TonB-linked outer membrane protein n=1 Tax=Catalinimonas alkaloidigena TaxID=1075417 RepID=UPI0024057D5C|nr:SusC/RagA family TonB-linked outer membrane protein [Catalinimonas alkaloidigena]MDF9795930.1 TonB-linked SusC/RagA family outer membrane protein [Catalinimonas alkaloidigena]